MDITLKRKVRRSHCIRALLGSVRELSRWGFGAIVYARVLLWGGNQCTRALLGSVRTYLGKEKVKRIGRAVLRAVPVNRSPKPVSLGFQPIQSPLYFIWLQDA